MLIRKNVIFPLVEKVNCRNNMVEELDMEQTNNANFALFCEMLEWFNTTYCYIFVNEHPFLLSVQNISS